jgi:hypothetical protein
MVCLIVGLAYSGTATEKREAATATPFGPPKSANNGIKFG